MGRIGFGWVCAREEEEAGKEGGRRSSDRRGRRCEGVHVAVSTVEGSRDGPGSREARGKIRGDRPCPQGSGAPRLHNTLPRPDAPIDSMIEIVSAIPGTNSYEAANAGYSGLNAAGDLDLIRNPELRRELVVPFRGPAGSDGGAERVDPRRGSSFVGSNRSPHSPRHSGAPARPAAGRLKTTNGSAASQTELRRGSAAGHHPSRHLDPAQPTADVVQGGTVTVLVDESQARI